MRYAPKTLSYFILIFFSFSSFATDNVITVRVTTDEKTASGIGYRVDGHEKGGLGKSYKGKGPKDKEYLFGYRKNPITGSNIHCGSLRLTQDSHVNLVTKGETCHCVLQQ